MIIIMDVNESYLSLLAIIVPSNSTMDELYSN
jgi:hypothetical protein